MADHYAERFVEAALSEELARERGSKVAIHNRSVNEPPIASFANLGDVGLHNKGRRNLPEILQACAIIELQDLVVDLLLSII